MYLRTLFVAVSQWDYILVYVYVDMPKYLSYVCKWKYTLYKNMIITIESFRVRSIRVEIVTLKFFLYIFKLIIDSF